MAQPACKWAGKGGVWPANLRPDEATMQQTFAPLRLVVAALAVAALALDIAAPARADSSTAPTAAGNGTAPAAADPAVEQARQYSDCMELARTAPDQALRSAQDWQAKGGGVPAGHCNAVALIGLARYSEAAAMMESLGEQEAKTNKQLAAGLYGQAGQARLMTGDNQHAFADQTKALALKPDDPELLTDRSVTEVSMARYWQAVDDLNRAHDLAPDRVDVLIFRASAYRFLQTYDLARDDIERAIKLEPDNPEAYLERGVLRSLTKDLEGARADWQHTIALAPGTPVANQAKADLLQLDQATKLQAPAAQPVQPSLPLILPASQPPGEPASGQPQ